MLFPYQQRPAGSYSPVQLLLLAVAREDRQEVVGEAEEGPQRRPAGEEGAEEVVVALQMSSR